MALFYDHFFTNALRKQIKKRSWIPCSQCCISPTPHSQSWEVYYVDNYLIIMVKDVQISFNCMLSRRGLLKPDNTLHSSVVDGSISRFLIVIIYAAWSLSGVSLRGVLYDQFFTNTLRKQSKKRTWLNSMFTVFYFTYAPFPDHSPFRRPNARTLVAFTDSVDRTPELSLRSRIRGPDARSIVAFTDAGSCHCVHGFRELYSTRIMRIVRVTDSDAMKSRRGTCHDVAGFHTEGLYGETGGGGRGVWMSTLTWTWLKWTTDSQFISAEALPVGYGIQFADKWIAQF
jgi:hypothetical protein